jgi:hypothetical protein
MIRKSVSRIFMPERGKEGACALHKPRAIRYGHPTMHVLVVQPPNPPEALSGARRTAYVPAAPLLHLASFLQTRGRHTCRVIDGDVLRDPLAETAEAVAATPDPKLLLMRADLHQGVETARLLEACGGAEAALRVALLGPLPTHAPTVARQLAPYAYLARGDPEPMIKAFLDSVDLPQRLGKIPGLWAPEVETPPAPHWLPALKGHSFEVLQTVSWLASPRERGEVPHEASFRLTRGNTGLPPDQDADGGGEPLRWMDLRELGLIFEKCAYWGIGTIHLADPPGVWSPEVLDQWLTTLDQQRNTMGWTFRMLPALLGEDIPHRLRLTECRQVRFVLPSTRPDTLAEYGCILRPRAFAGVLRDLRRAGVEPVLECWVGGPGEPPAEEERLFDYLRRLGYPACEVQAFPCRVDAPRQQVAGLDPAASLREALRSGEVSSPPPVWDGPAGLAQQRQVADRLEARLRRSLVWALKHNWEEWNPFTWIRRLEALTAAPRG